MAKTATYPVVVGLTTYDLADVKPIELGELSKSALAEVYNAMVVVGHSIEGFDADNKYNPVKSFADKEAGVKRIGALHSSVVAFVGGQMAEKERGKKPAKAPRADRAEAQATIKAEREARRAAKGAGSKVPGKRGRGAAIKDADVITVVAETNPKRQGTKGFEQFAKILTGMTAGDYRQAIGAGPANSELRYCVEKGYIAITAA